MWEDWAIFKQTVAFVFKTILNTVTAAGSFNKSFIVTINKRQGRPGSDCIQICSNKIYIDINKIMLIMQSSLKI